MGKWTQMYLEECAREEERLKALEAEKKVKQPKPQPPAVQPKPCRTIKAGFRVAFTGNRLMHTLPPGDRN